MRTIVIAEIGECFNGDMQMARKLMEAAKHADCDIVKFQLLDINEVAVCGDSGNDLYMFARFPHTFAMEHSPEHFKSQANHVISRISGLQEYLDNPSLLENDKIKEINYEKALDN